MSIVLETVPFPKPNPTSTRSPSQLNKPSPLAVLTFKLYPSQLGTRGSRLTVGGLGFPFPSLTYRWNTFNRSAVLFAASHEESHPEIEVDEEKAEVKMKTEEAEEAWKQALESFKDQALKIRSVSQEAYEMYSKKAIVVLKDTAEQLKIQADDARLQLGEVAKEINEEGKEYFSTAAQNSPEPIKEVVRTFTSYTDEVNDIAGVRDFYIGVPYGLILSLGGFLSFMMTGSITAIRFGVILGGSLLFLSVSSLRSYRRGEVLPLALKGQAAIAIILFLRELSLLSKGTSIVGVLTTLISGSVAALYIYRIVQDRKQKKMPKTESGN